MTNSTAGELCRMFAPVSYGMEAILVTLNSAHSLVQRVDCTCAESLRAQREYSESQREGSAGTYPAASLFDNMRKWA